MIQLAEELGVDEVRLDNLIVYGLPGFLEDQCLYEDDSDVVEVINSIERPKSNLSIFTPQLYKRTITDRPCKMPFRTLSVDSNGDVSVCCMIPPHQRYGNIFRDKDVWNNSSFRNKRQMLIDKSLLLPKFCRTCHGMGTNRRILSKHEELSTKEKKE